MKQGFIFSALLYFWRSDFWSSEGLLWHFRLYIFGAQTQTLIENIEGGQYSLLEVRGDHNYQKKIGYQICFQILILHNLEKV